MTSALVVNESHHSNPKLIEALHKQHSDWEMTSVDKYEDAISKIESEAFDIMTLDSHLPSRQCQNLAETLHKKRPNAAIYIAMEDQRIKTDYSRVMNRGLIFIPSS